MGSVTFRGAEFKAGEVLEGVEYISPADPAGAIIRGVCADSRQAGEDFLFVAVRGGRVDGHDYLSQAVAKGCRVLVVETERSREPQIKQLGRRTLLVAVPDTRLALGTIAANYYGRPADGLRLTGLTGTNGKTTTSYLLESVLRAAGKPCGVIGTVDYRYRTPAGDTKSAPAPFTTPEPLELQRLLREMADAGVEHVVMEVSSHALAQYRLAGLQFDVAVFTNLTREHLDFHRDMEDYFASKKKLFADHLRKDGRAVIMVDDLHADDREAGYGRRLTKTLGSAGSRLLTCGMTDACDVFPREYHFSLQGQKVVIATPSGDLAIDSPLIGEFNLRNLLTAAAAGLAMNLPPGPLSKGLTDLRAVPGRLEPVRQQAALKAPPRVFVDYAHTPDALENVLRALRRLQPARVICVFGCGGDRDPGKRPIMGRAAGRLSDVVIATSDNPRSEEPLEILRQIEPGLRDSGLPRRPVSELSGTQRGYTTIVSRQRAIAAAIRLAHADDVVLITGKGHEQYQLTADGIIAFDDRREAENALAGLQTLPPSWTLEEILRATGGRTGTAIEPGRTFAGISTDTRTITPGELFVALRGARFDGTAFAADALKKGAAGILAERKSTPPGCCRKIPVITVEDSRQALGDLARFRRRNLPAMRVLAITGSSGKTTVKEMAAAILGQQHRIIKTRGNFNNLIGLPLSLLPATAGTEFAVLEMGMNRPGEIRRLAEIAEPDIACITNVQPAHLEGVGDLAGVAAAKSELFAAVAADGRLVVNGDDPLVWRLARPWKAGKITFAATAAGRRRGAEVKATHIRRQSDGTSLFTLHIRDRRRRIRLHTPGLHNISNALAATGLALAAGLTLEEIAAGLESFRPAAGRGLINRLHNGLMVIDDTYNANPGSVRAALQTLRDLRGNGRSVAVLGDMLELGDTGKSAHRQIGKTAAETEIDYLAAFGEFASETVAGARRAGLPAERARRFTDKRKLIAWLRQLLAAGSLAAGDWLLLKGSRGMRMETVLAGLGAPNSEPGFSES